MRKRRGRYLKSREESITILRTDIDADPPVSIVASDKAIVVLSQTSSRGNFMADRGFAENDRIYLVTFNYVTVDIREEDVIVRMDKLRTGVDVTEYNMEDEPLWVAIISNTKKVTRLTCRDNQRG